MPQEVGRLIDDTSDAKPVAGGTFGQRPIGRRSHRAIRFWNRIAMRIGRRVSQIGVDPVDERIAHRVLHVFRLFVDFIPRKVQCFAQKLLDEPVPPQYSQSQAPAR